MPQGRRIFPTLTVKENLIVAQRARAESRHPWNLARVFDVFPRLQERQQQAAGSLSGGEQQMLAIGRALMGNPKVLLMDEPSEGLAPLIVAEVGKTIARLKAEGQSIVLVEQNLKLALELADERGDPQHRPHRVHRRRRRARARPGTYHPASRRLLASRQKPRERPSS